tara:strand:+ start:468 stop:683 length:216 start_codon:yes stop_codon:yes gene_type:complete
MDSTEYAILVLLYSGALYKYAICIDPDAQDTPEHWFEYWRENKEHEFLTSILPEHLQDHKIVGIETLHGII